MNPFPQETETELNRYQRQAVLDDSMACVVNAKVGSGKTTVLISKVLHLHYEKSVSYEEMVVLTFTNKAADEVKERLRRREPQIEKECLKGFGTFHSVALYLLREILPVEELGYAPEFTVITPEEEEELARELITREGLSIKYQNRLKKRLEQEREQYEKGLKQTKYGDDLMTLFRLLSREKVKQNIFTFRDLIRVSNYLLNKYKEKITWNPKWLIVDEVQDCDEIQMEFMERIVGRGARLFAVGDPNQVIYSWRGSSSNIFYQLKERFQATELTLPINYRSSGVILEVAKQFQQNPGDLTGTKDQGELIRVKNHYNPFQEALYLVGEIGKKREQGIPYKEIAVFYRLQSQAELLEKILKQEGIPCQVSVRKTVQDIPILDWFLKEMKVRCHKKDLFEELICTDNQSDKNVPTVEEIYELLQLDQSVRPNSNAYEKDKEVICILIERMLSYVKEQQLGMTEGFRKFLNESALYGIQILQKEVDMTEDSVKLMTLHASKGLEFSSVYIVGVNYGLIPLRSQNFEEEDEERRLFFVGITRARDTLELSYYTNPGQVRVAEGPSRYLQMIPAHLIHKVDSLVQSKNQEDSKRSYTTNGKVDLQKMRKEVEKASTVQTLAMLFGGEEKKECGHTESEESTKIEQLDRKKPYTEKENLLQVEHPKYGKGVIVSEKNDMIEVDFVDYGKKQFMKAFSQLTNIDM